MQLVYLAVLILLMLGLLCSLIRAGLGPTWFDRILSVNTFTSQTVLLMAVYFYATGHPEYIDIALLYGLIGYAGSIALARYFDQESSDQESSDRGEDR